MGGFPKVTSRVIFHNSAVSYTAHCHSFPFSQSELILHYGTFIDGDSDFPPDFGIYDNSIGCFITGILEQ